MALWLTEMQIRVQIKNAVEKMYGVTVEKVATMRYQGKNKSRYTKARVISWKSTFLQEGDCHGFRG